MFKLKNLPLIIIATVSIDTFALPIVGGVVQGVGGATQAVGGAASGAVSGTTGAVSGSVKSTVNTTAGSVQAPVYNGNVIPGTNDTQAPAKMKTFNLTKKGKV